MANSGGRYVLEKGKRRLVSNTQEPPRKGAAVVPVANNTKPEASKSGGTNPKLQPADASSPAITKEAE